MELQRWPYMFDVWQAIVFPPSGDHIVLELHQRSFFTCIGDDEVDDGRKQEDYAADDDEYEEKLKK
ncbi:hypothetical protein YC2023_005695 [Brassica napus]